MHMCEYMPIYAHIYIHTHIYIFAYIYIYIYMLIYAQGKAQSQSTRRKCQSPKKNSETSAIFAAHERAAAASSVQQSIF